jgi:hypothetical protein
MYTRPMTFARRRWMMRVAAAIAAPVVLALAFVPTRGHLDNSTVALVLAVCVVAVAVVGSRLESRLAGLVAGLSFDFLHTKPYGSLAMYRMRDVVAAVLLVVIGALAGELSQRLRRSERAAADEERDFARVRLLAERAACGDEPGDLVHVVEAELISLFGLMDCWFEPLEDSIRSATPALPRIVRRGFRRPPGDASPALGFELSVAARGEVFGRYVLVPAEENIGRAPSAERCRVAVALADQLGVALVAFPHDALALGVIGRTARQAR